MRGIGVHHAGMLPFLKEAVELLFQAGLVKVSFTYCHELSRPGTWFHPCHLVEGTFTGLASLFVPLITVTYYG